MIVKVYTDYSPVAILRGVKGKEYVLPTDELALKMGLVGNYVEIDDSNIPNSREHRNEWHVKDGKVEPDPVKVQEKLGAIAAKEAKKDSVLSKLKISKEELANLLK